jgi:thioredoxin-related protein
MLNGFLLLALSFLDVTTYGEAIQKSQQENKPLLVIVSANYCAPCQVLKRNVIKPMLDSGELKEVYVSYVEEEKDKELFDKLLGENKSIPKIIIYHKKNDKWFRGKVGMIWYDNLTKDQNYQVNKVQILKMIREIKK